MPTLRSVVRATTGLGALIVAACSRYDSMPLPPPVPTPPPASVTVNAYILPDAPTRGPLAFGEPPLIVYKGERLHWVNVDTVTHALVADTSNVPDLLATGDLPPGGEQSFIVTATGTTTFHCTIHPVMVGTLVVRDR